MTPESIRVSAVVPVYQNAGSLPELNRRLAAALDEVDGHHEILFVDDASPDGAAAVIRRLAKDDHRTGGLLLSENMGQNRAVLAGLAASRGQWVVALDADLQDPPEAIPHLLDAGERGAGAVFAGRRGRYAPWGKLVTSRIYKGVMHLLTGVPRDAGLFVAIHRRVVTQLLAMRTAHPAVTAMIGHTGHPCVSVPVERQPRPSGRSAYGAVGRARSGLRSLLCVAECRLGRALGPVAPLVPKGAERVGAAGRWPS